MPTPAHPTNTRPVCVSGSQWVEHTGSCYWLHDAATDMAAAEVTCARLLGAVAELESPGEGLNVNEVLGGVNVEAWVGLRRDSLTGA